MSSRAGKVLEGAASLYRAMNPDKVGLPDSLQPLAVLGGASVVTLTQAKAVAKVLKNGKNESAADVLAALEKQILHFEESGEKAGKVVISKEHRQALLSVLETTAADDVDLDDDDVDNLVGALDALDDDSCCDDEDDVEEAAPDVSSDYNNLYNLLKKMVSTTYRKPDKGANSVLYSLHRIPTARRALQALDGIIQQATDAGKSIEWEKYFGAVRAEDESNEDSASDPGVDDDINVNPMGFKADDKFPYLNRFIVDVVTNFKNKPEMASRIILANLMKQGGKKLLSQLDDMALAFATPEVQEEGLKIRPHLAKMIEAMTSASFNNKDEWKQACELLGATEFTDSDENNTSAYTEVGLLVGSWYASTGFVNGDLRKAQMVADGEEPPKEEKPPMEGPDKEAEPADDENPLKADGEEDEAPAESFKARVALKLFTNS